MIPFPTEWKIIKFMFQTTNQLGFWEKSDRKPLLYGWIFLTFHHFEWCAKSVCVGNGLEVVAITGKNTLY
jgi:hypothetical protein